MAEQVLVVFLSTALAIFLVIAIIVGVQAIRLLKSLQRVASKAEGFVNSAEAVSDMLRHAAGAFSISRFVQGVVNFAHHKKDDKGDTKK